MEWFKFTSFSYLQLLLTVDLDAFLRYRMSHQDLFSVHQTTYATLLKHLKLRFSMVYFYHCYFGSLLLFIVNSSYWIQDQVSALVEVVCVEIFWSRHVTHIEPLSFCTLFRFCIVFFLGGGVGQRVKGVKRILASIFWKDGTYVGFYHNETKRSSFPVMTVSCVDNKG